MTKINKASHKAIKKKCSGSQTMDFKKGQGVFIFCFYFQSNMGRVFIFCFYFQQVKNIMQTSSILLFWQTNNTIVFTQRDLDLDNMKQPAAILVLQNWYTILVVPVFSQNLPVSAILVQILVNTSIPVSSSICNTRRYWSLPKYVYCTREMSAV